MRRWLPLALLVALGALAWLVLRDGERRAPIARTTPDAPAVAPVETQPAEVSAQSTSGEQRAELAPAAAEPAGNGAMPDPSLAHLTVRVVGKASKAPVSKVRIFIEDANPQGPRTTKIVSVSRGDISTSPITGADGLVVFALPPGKTFMLRARSEDERFLPRGLE